MPVFIDVIESIFKLGLPLAALSWFLFTQIYNSGDMDREADRKAIKSQLQALKSTYKKKKKHKVNIVQDKWMRFGGGFYGLAALWTFVIIELTDVYNFTFHNPGSEALFGDGAVSLFVTVLLNQIQNFITAFVWFSYWEADSLPLLVFIAYAGYWIGVEVARRQSVIVIAPWLERLRALLQLWKR